MELKTRVERMERRTTLLETLYRLQSAIDRRDWDYIAASFLPDAHGYGARGVDAIITQMQAHLGGCGPTQHLLGNETVVFNDPDATRATVRSSARVFHLGTGPKEGAFFECLGDYTDEWLELDGAWRLHRRWFQMRITLGDIGVLRPAETGGTFRESPVRGHERQRTREESEHE